MTKQNEAAIPGAPTGGPAAAAGERRRPRVLARFLASRQVRWGIGIVVFMTLLAVFGGFFAPHSVTEPVSTPYAPPGKGLLLGSDQIGRDVFSRVL
ncbi:MAG: hypothetical protein J0H64_02560, partial [Actinobacteria bacterium]|nr:hypothetical protein [Actinomycetota bacterium]